MSNRNPIERITIGKRFYYDGKQWHVVALDGAAVRVRDLGGAYALIGFGELLQHADFDMAANEDEAGAEIDGEDLGAGPTCLLAGFLDSTAPSEAKNKANKKAEAVNLLMTGFYDGIVNPNGEPHPEFGPQNGRLMKSRVASMAAERKISSTTVWRWIQIARDHGSEALIDKRAVTSKGRLGTCPTEVMAAMAQVAAAQANKSKVTDNQLLRQVKNNVIANHGGKVKIPADSTLRRYFAEYKREYGLHLSTKTQQGNALRPDQMGAPIVVSRPFEVVEIDSTRLDIIAISEVDGAQVPVMLTLALDVFSRSLVAWQFSPVSDKNVDAALLLHDMVTPKAWLPGWSEHARWRYGIRETLVLPGSQECLAGVPIGIPTTLSLDNGKIYTSDAMKSACLQMGVSLQYSRVRRPADKPHIERVFGTIRSRFVERLPGYKGPRLDHRGTIEEVENRATLFVSEIEELFAEWVATDYQNRPHGGLSNIAIPKMKMTPNQAFDAGIAMTGFVPLVVDASLAVSLLPSGYRVVGTLGIELNSLMYNSPILDPYRKRQSPFTDLGGKWPIRYDPRNLSVLWFWEGDFQDPHLGEWVPIPARISHSVGAFSDIHVAYAKSLFTDADRLGTRKEQCQAVEETMAGMFDRVHAEGPANKREASAMRLGEERVNLAVSTFPHATTEPEPDRNRDAPSSEQEETWEFDLDNLEPFPMADDLLLTKDWDLS